MTRRPRNPRVRAFTALELVVGVVITSLIVTATATALTRLVRSREFGSSHRQAFARASDAAARIALDLENALRDADLSQCRISIIDGGSDGAEADQVTIMVRSSRPVRGSWKTTGMAEGEEYESSYKLREDGASTALWNRRDIAFDDEVDAGGVASKATPSVSSLSVQAFDGEKWYDEWDSDSDGLPHAVRITARAQSDGREVDAVARRVVAIDRVPLAPRDENAEDDGSSSGESSGGGS
jgi:type II secretion system protein J